MSEDKKDAMKIRTEIAILIIILALPLVIGLPSCGEDTPEPSDAAYEHHENENSLGAIRAKENQRRAEEHREALKNTAMLQGDLRDASRCWRDQLERYEKGEVTARELRGVLTQYEYLYTILNDGDGGMHARSDPALIKMIKMDAGPELLEYADAQRARVVFLTEQLEAIPSVDGLSDIEIRKTERVRENMASAIQHCKWLIELAERDLERIDRK